MKKAAATLIVVSLAGNIFPTFNIVAISVLFPLYFLGKDSAALTLHGYGPHTARKFLVAAYLYWTLSYLLTGAGLANFLSFDFIRFDGAFFIAYLPLFLITDVRLEPQFIRRVIGFFLSLMSAVALLGLAEFVDSTILPLGLSVLPGPLQFLHNASLSTNIFHGLFRAHNAAGAIYAIATLISFSLLVGEKNPALVSPPSFWLATNFAGMALSQSRTAYVAFLVALLLTFFRDRATLARAFKYATPILVPLLYLLLIQPTVAHRTQEVSDLEDPNIVSRFFYYQRAFDDFVQSPIVGTGFARFNDELKNYTGIPYLVYFATSGSIVNDDSHAHNSYLHFLAEGGLVGLFLMLAVWISLYRWLDRQKQIFAAGSFGKKLAEAIQASIVLEFLMSFTEHMMGTAMTSLAILTLAGLFLNLVGWKYRLASLVQPAIPARGGVHACP